MKERVSGVTAVIAVLRRLLCLRALTSSRDADWEVGRANVSSASPGEGETPEKYFRMSGKKPRPNEGFNKLLLKWVLREGAKRDMVRVGQVPCMGSSVNSARAGRQQR